MQRPRASSDTPAMSSLHISTNQQCLLLRPPKDPKSLPEELEELIHGEVVLNLSKPKAIRKIHVKLKSTFQLNLKNRQQSGTLLERELQLDCQGEIFKAGENRFSFSFCVPASSAPYEKTSVGRIWQQLEASVRFAAWPARELNATLPVYFCVAPATTGINEVSRGLDLQMDNYSDELGLISVTAKADDFTVAGLLDFRLNFLSPALNIELQHVQAYVTQTVKLTVFPKDSFDDRIPLCVFDERNKRDVFQSPDLLLYQQVTGTRPPVPLHHIRVGEESTFKTLVRLPSDEILRPTSASGSDSPLDISHDLLIDISYTLPDGKQRLMTVQKSISIGSCCCTEETLYLPVYQEKENFVRGRRALCIPDRLTNRGGCLCSESNTTLLAQAAETGLLGALALETHLSRPNLSKARQASAYTI